MRATIVCLTEAQNLRVETAHVVSDEDLRLISRLYDDLYRQKYSRSNAAYSEDFLRTAINSGVLKLRDPQRGWCA